MDLGAFTSGLLTGLREGVEAALILAIICAYLAKTGNQRHFPNVFLGAGLALAAVSLSSASCLLRDGRQLRGAVRAAVRGADPDRSRPAVVTWMLFWMRRQAASVRGELHAAVDRALDDGSAIALAVLAFVAVIREGIETSLFLVGQAAAAPRRRGRRRSCSGRSSAWLIAAVIGVGFYQGSRRINLATFFRWTGVALVFIAAGLLSHAVHEFIEIGVITVGTQTLFDLSAILPHEGEGGSLIGQFLRALFGYTSTPEVTTFVVWLTYVWSS